MTPARRSNALGGRHFLPSRITWCYSGETAGTNNTMVKIAKGDLFTAFWQANQVPVDYPAWIAVGVRKLLANRVRFTSLQAKSDFQPFGIFFPVTHSVSGEQACSVLYDVVL